MSVKSTPKLVKVKADYPIIGDFATLWGIDFVKAGSDYTASVDEETAKSLIDSGRATKV